MEDRDLISLQKTKEELLFNLLKASKAIKSLIIEEKLEELNEKLQDRQEIILLLDVLNQQIYEKTNIADQDNENADILREIEKADKENIDLANGKLDEFRVQICDLNQMKKGMDKYKRVFKSSDGFFIDAKK